MAGRTFDVVVVGSANIDLVVRTDRIPTPGETLIGDSYNEYPGGKGLNQAVAAARSGARVAFVGALGDDDAGDRLRLVADDDGIDTSWAPSIAATSTGRALITVADGGENTIVVVPGANGLVSAADIPSALVVLAQLEIPLLAVAAAFGSARARGAITILNPAPATPLLPGLVAVTDVVVPNEHEIGLIGGVDALLTSGVQTVIVTKGAGGVDVIDSDGTVTSVPAINVAAIDSTGAGDAFCGGLAARLADGATLGEAVTWAVCAGGLATTRQGAVPSLPTRNEILARLHG